MAGLKTNFWGWDSPLIEMAVAWLSRDQPAERALDLSDTLIVVPTAESSRRLREALAAEAAKRDSAVMAPFVWHPEQCLLTDEDRRRTASATQTLLAWIRVLQDADLSRLTKLFPVLPDKQSATWLTSLAETMIDQQSTLGAGGLSFADVAASEHAAADRQRWLELSELERAFDQLLRTKNLVSAQQMKHERSREPVLPPDVRRICVIGVADPPPLFGHWLRAAAAHCDVSVCVQAPESAAEQFNDIGQPGLAHWGEGATVVVPVDEAQLHIVADPAAQARKADELLPGLLRQGRTAVGVCDAETASHLQDRLAAGGVRAYEPGGTAAELHGFVSLARLWRDLVRTGSWKSFAALLRNPDFASVCCAPAFPVPALLRAADDFADERLPVTLESAQELLKNSAVARWQPVLRAVEDSLQMVAQFTKRSLPDAVRDFLIRIYGGHAFRANEPHERDLMQLTTAWIQIADSLDADAPMMGARLGRADALVLSIDLLAAGQLGDPRGDIDLVIQGWLELLWEPAPNLIVLGCNEENLPGIFISHPFLPDRLRAGLGLPCQATRYARDAYLLRALAGQRARDGALHLLCGQWSEQGDAMRPSRLLFLCDDDALPQRVNHLFPKDGAEVITQQPPRTWAWKLKPRATEPKKQDTISASRLNDYLACPFRFYLKRELNMQPVDPTKAEMSAIEFGNLVHKAFKALADDESLRDCTDEKKLATFLCEVATLEAERLYGERLPFTVRLQLDSALQRLQAAAAFEAAHREDGWRTMHGEFVIGGEDDAHPLLIGTRRFEGKIDRIDQRDGEFLILDFKTREKAIPPHEAHLTKLSAAKAAATEDWLVHQDANGKSWRWSDLQLPLYAKAWSLRHEGNIRAGYFQLPTSVQGTEITLWPEMDQAVLDSAMRCAGEAVRRLDARIHWPPNEKVEYDDFESLFAGRAPEEVIDPEEILKLKVTA